MEELRRHARELRHVCGAVQDTQVKQQFDLQQSDSNEMGEAFAFEKIQTHDRLERVCVLDDQVPQILSPIRDAFMSTAQTRPTTTPAS